ncbi:hypothetical protein [Halomonas sp. 25-S5]|uniref:hypothetical protein n=1 Tax=Halomonas sp. 25-S5 TaxID=2994065 RepID=UPI002468BF57|nr:hypothetical protein [Halomonas sp. 25-S5]
MNFKTVALAVFLSFLVGSFSANLQGNWLGDYQEIQEAFNNVEQYQIELYNRYDEMYKRLDKLESYH